MSSGRFIDLAPLTRLLHLTGPVDGRALVTAFLEDLLTTQTGFSAAWNGPDFAALRAHAHVLTALAGTVGDTELQSLAQQLNLAAHAQTLGELMEMKPHIMAGLTDLIAVLLRQQSRLED